MESKIFGICRVDPSSRSRSTGLLGSLWRSTAFSDMWRGLWYVDGVYAKDDSGSCYKDWAPYSGLSFLRLFEKEQRNRFWTIWNGALIGI